MASKRKISETVNYSACDEPVDNNSSCDEPIRKQKNSKRITIVEDKVDGLVCDVKEIMKILKKMVNDDSSTGSVSTISTVTPPTSSPSLNEEYLQNIAPPELLHAWDREKSGSPFFETNKTRTQSDNRKLQGDYYKKVIDIVVLGGREFVESSRSNYNMALNTVSHYIFTLMTQNYRLTDVKAKYIRDDLSEYVNLITF